MSTLLSMTSSLWFLNSIVTLSSILGAGTFVKTQYIPRLAEISNLVNLKAIWSRSEESARGAVEIAGKHFPGAKCKWGDKGFEKIIADGSTLGVAVVLAGQAQVYLILKLASFFIES